MKQRPGWTARKHAGKHRADIGRTKYSRSSIYYIWPYVNFAARRPPLPPPALRNLPFATLLGSKETYLSLHNHIWHLYGGPVTTVYRTTGFQLCCVVLLSVYILLQYTHLSDIWNILLHQFFPVTLGYIFFSCSLRLATVIRRSLCAL